MAIPDAGKACVSDVRSVCQVVCTGLFDWAGYKENCVCHITAEQASTGSCCTRCTRVHCLEEPKMT